MATQFTKLDIDWLAVKNACRLTVNKAASTVQPILAWRRGLLISEHSPLRLISVSWLWADIKSWVATHWCRHKWECFISTQRGMEDRDDRRQGALVNFAGQANAQHLIDTWRKRLCFRAHPETRQLALDFKRELAAYDPELSWALVPNCVYRCGCPEPKSCGWWQSVGNRLSAEQLSNIRARYDYYQDIGS